MWNRLVIWSPLICLLLSPILQKQAPFYLQIITLKTEAELNNVLLLLQSSQEFSDLAQKHSTHPTAGNGGIWGPIRLDQLPGAVRDHVEKAEAGALIHFFDPALGYVILRKLEPATARKVIFQEILNRGTIHLQRNERDQALQELKKAVALDPGSAAAHQLLGQAHLMQSSYEMLSEAKAEFVQALAIDPKLIWSRFYLARIYLDLGRPQKAKEQLESALIIRPNVPHLLSLLGEANRKLGHIDLSMEQNRKSLEIDPSFFVAHYYLGLAYLDLKKEEEAIREIETALKAGQPAAEICLTLGSVYLRKGSTERAIELYQKAVAADPAKPEAHLRLAQAYRLKKMPDLAFKELAQAYPEGRRFLSTPYYQQLQVEILFERGLIYQEKGALSQASEAYRSVLELDPNHGQTHRQLAAVLFQQGEYQRALEHALKAAELKSPVEASLLGKIKSKRRPEK